jgi:hypothetical protein
MTMSQSVTETAAALTAQFKALGASSKVPLPINIVEAIIAKARAYDALPPVAKDVAKYMQEAG